MLSAVKFYKEFIEQVKETNTHENNKIFFDIYKNDKDFTALINKTIIPKIIKSFDSNLKIQHEYFRIDTIGWKVKDLPPDTKRVDLKYHPWDLIIAVEHENKKTDWLDEVIKLVHINCPLKIIIAYNYCDQRNEQEREKLNYVAKCMQQVEAFNLTTNNDEYLIIIGNGEPKNKKSASYTNFDYRGYTYNYLNKSFERITMPTRI